MKNLRKLTAALLALALVVCLGACSLPAKMEEVLDIDDFEETQSEWDGLLQKKDVSENDGSDEESEGVVLGDTGNLMKLLLIGVDSRDDDFSGRSDTMILVTVNKETKKVLLTSLLRDIYVEIPGYKSNRLNAANVYGGADLLKETIEDNFGIPVDNSITVNFCTVRDIVDALGGIDLELTADEVEIMNGYIVSQNDNFGYEPGTDLMEEADGTFHCNGNQTLAYCRIRYIGTDFARTQRQRTVIKKCLEKVKGLGALEMVSFVTKFYDRIDSDISMEDLLSLITTFTDLSDYTVETFTIPMDGTWSDMTVDDMAVLSVDFEANAQEWYKKAEE